MSVAILLTLAKTANEENINTPTHITIGIIAIHNSQGIENNNYEGWRNESFTPAFFIVQSTRKSKKKRECKKSASLKHWDARRRDGQTT